MNFLINSNPFQPVIAAAPVAKVLVWGPPGAGKTHFMLGAPKPAVADAENRIHLFAGRPEFGQINAYSTQDIDAIHAAISYLETGFEKRAIWDPILRRNIEQLTSTRTGVHDFETFCIDGMTVIWEARQFEQQVKVEKSDRERKDAFAQKDWGEMKRDYKSLLNRLIQLPMNVCCTARLAEQRDQDTMRVIGEKADVEKSTPYAFDLIVKLQPSAKGSIVPDAVILKQTGNVYHVGQVIENATWDTLVTPITARLQAARDAAQQQQQAVRELVATWRDALATQGKDQAAADNIAKAIILRRTGRSSSADLTMEEIQQLKAIFSDANALRAELQS
jgi:hypothetical protein